MSLDCTSLFGPVRHSFQAFLSDAEAARLMRVGRTATVSLLSGYIFSQHVFRPESASRLSRMTALYAQWDMRITRMCLPLHWDGPLTDENSGVSLLPGTLDALALGWVPESDQSTSMFAQLASLASTGDVTADETDARDSENCHALLRRVQPKSSWRLTPYSNAHGGYHAQPIPAGAIPHGVRFLQLSYHYNQPLLPGVIPATVRFLQCGHGFSQTLGEGSLPVGLTDLILGDSFTAQLLPGALPSSLRRLRLGALNQPFHCLPPHLQRLDMGLRYNQPLPPLRAACLPDTPQAR